MVDFRTFLNILSSKGIFERTSVLMTRRRRFLNSLLKRSRDIHIGCLFAEWESVNVPVGIFSTKNAG